MKQPSIIIDMLSSLQKNLAKVKEDRDRMFAPILRFFPIRRFSKLLNKLAEYTESDPCERYLTPLEIEALREKIAEFFFCEEKVGTVSCSFFSLIAEVFCCACRDLLRSTETDEPPLERETYNVLQMSLAIFKNIMSCSLKALEQVVNHSELMRTLLDVITRISSPLISSTIKNNLLEELFNSTMGVVYNMARLGNHDTVMQIFKLGFVQAVTPIIECNRNIRKDHAILIMVFVAEANIKKKFCCDESSLRHLLVKLRGALVSSERKCGDYGTIELMKGIRELAVIEKNKKTLFELGCLGIMQKILEMCDGDDEMEEELPIALEILAELASERENASWIEEKVRYDKFMRCRVPTVQRFAKNLKLTIQAGRGSGASTHA